MNRLFSTVILQTIDGWTEGPDWEEPNPAQSLSTIYHRRYTGEEGDNNYRLDTGDNFYIGSPASLRRDWKPYSCPWVCDIDGVLGNEISFFFGTQVGESGIDSKMSVNAAFMYGVKISLFDVDAHYHRYYGVKIKDSDGAFRLRRDVQGLTIEGAVLINTPLLLDEGHAMIDAIFRRIALIGAKIKALILGTGSNDVSIQDMYVQGSGDIGIYARAGHEAVVISAVQIINVDHQYEETNVVYTGVEIEAGGDVVAKGVEVQGFSGPSHVFRGRVLASGLVSKRCGAGIIAGHNSELRDCMVMWTRQLVGDSFAYLALGDLALINCGVNLDETGALGVVVLSEGSTVTVKGGDYQLRLPLPFATALGASTLILENVRVNNQLFSETIPMEKGDSWRGALSPVARDTIIIPNNMPVMLPYNHIPEFRNAISVQGSDRPFESSITLPSGVKIAPLTVGSLKLYADEAYLDLDPNETAIERLRYSTPENIFIHEFVIAASTEVSAKVVQPDALAGDGWAQNGRAYSTNDNNSFLGNFPTPVTQQLERKSFAMNGVDSEIDMPNYVVPDRNFLYYHLTLRNLVDNPAGGGVTIMTHSGYRLNVEFWGERINIHRRSPDVQHSDNLYFSDHYDSSRTMLPCTALELEYFSLKLNLNTGELEATVNGVAFTLTTVPEVIGMKGEEASTLGMFNAFNVRRTEVEFLTFDLNGDRFYDATASTDDAILVDTMGDGSTDAVVEGGTLTPYIKEVTSPAELIENEIYEISVHAENVTAGAIVPCINGDETILGDESHTVNGRRTWLLRAPANPTTIGIKGQGFSGGIKDAYLRQLMRTEPAATPFIKSFTKTGDNTALINWQIPPVARLSDTITANKTKSGELAYSAKFGYRDTSGEGDFLFTDTYSTARRSALSLRGGNTCEVYNHSVVGGYPDDGENATWQTGFQNGLNGGPYFELTQIAYMDADLQLDSNKGWYGGPTHNSDCIVINGSLNEASMRSRTSVIGADIKNSSDGVIDCKQYAQYNYSTLTGGYKPLRAHASGLSIACNLDLVQGEDSRYAIGPTYSRSYVALWNCAFDGIPVESKAKAESIKKTEGHYAGRGQLGEYTSAIHILHSYPTLDDLSRIAATDMEFQINTDSAGWQFLEVSNTSVHNFRGKLKREVSLSAGTHEIRCRCRNGASVGSWSNSITLTI